MWFQLQNSKLLQVHELNPLWEHAFPKFSLSSPPEWGISYQFWQALHGPSLGSDSPFKPLNPIIPIHINHITCPHSMMPNMWFHPLHPPWFLGAVKFEWEGRTLNKRNCHTSWIIHESYELWSFPIVQSVVDHPPTNHWLVVYLSLWKIWVRQLG